MLQFFHDIGYILFFNETSLNSVAILDVQWFIDAFKSITMDENQGNAMKDTNNPNQQFLWIKDFFSKPKDWNNFYHLGKLPCKTLVDFWESHGDKDFKEYGDIILKYMERLGLLVIGKNFHYIPCVNKMDIQTSLLARISSERYEKTSVICFRFKHCLHHFFFQRVVVSCMHEWKFLEIDGTPGLFKNIVLLEHKPKGFIIAIGVNKTSIQLLVYSISRSLHSSDTCKVRDTVEKILSSVVKTFHKAVEYEVGFSCMEKDKITKESEGRFILEEEAVGSAKAAEKGECFCNSNAPHNVNWRKMIKYWRKERNLRIRSREGTNPTRRYFSNQQRGDDLKNARSYEMQEHDESQVIIDIEDHHSEHGIFQVSDEESKKHYWRVIEKLIGISRDALKVYFDCKLSPQDLEKTLKLYGDEMKKGPYRFTEDQLLIMFPGDGSCPLSSMFDVSIMYKLLRNYVEDLPTPTKGWGKKPDIGDIKETDDLERIRIYRNKFSHAGQDSTLEKDEFNMYWMDISQAIMRLSNGELQADVYKLQKETEHNERKSCDDKKNG
ncbi:uncharacterized protein LOC133202710 [Saccostrea echinata]|uniref:uncharacterized protein LOC133202710 n=1 Tax=Saccostrea echinata TaxID=191078 RepID=UPI002A8111BD|nr:uncharacterized protein LOC133202710 [Saccostrea echinata]XP_061194555.1 uncharacterized protein LOC133202710 [Saccostrea echinata]